MKHTQNNISWFSIIEVLVGIFVFTLWLVSVYAVVQSTLQMSDYNRNYIIATNLWKEQSELMRHIRDSNYTQLKPYMQMNPLWNVDSATSFFWTGSYRIYNDFDATGNQFTTWVDRISDITDRASYQICQDDEQRYVYCDLSNLSHTPTRFYRYIDMSNVANMPDIKKIRSVVEWRSKWEHSFEVSMILADWRRL